MKVRMEACPMCRARGFDIDLDELMDADGWLECEHCGVTILPVDRNVLKEAAYKASLVDDPRMDFINRPRVQLDPDVVQRIKRKCYDATNFGRANDKLSRAFSEILIFFRTSAEAEAWDAGFDGGEWSSAAHARLRAKKVMDVSHKYGYSNYEAMLKSAQKVCDNRQLYMMGFLGLSNFTKVSEE